MRAISEFFRKTINKFSKYEEQVNSVNEINVSLNHEKTIFTSDEPISTQSYDKLNRALFAHRIAETLATRQESSNLIIGLFAPWGAGKTSVLKMMSESLEQYHDVIVVEFNPWYCQTEEQLLRTFFNTLADSLNQKITGIKEDIGKILKDYGCILSLASVRLPFVTFSTGNTAKELGDKLSATTLSETKDKIEQILNKNKKKIIILIDDIDRLDKKEIHTIFKLVKLSCGFNYISYVLAFDDNVVSAALGEKYGAGNQKDGRSFLEKIIQVPLHLPQANPITIRKMVLEAIDNAIKMADITLDNDEKYRLLRCLDSGMIQHFLTPRTIKVYKNALEFAIPLLKNEVNTVDHIIIEGIRILFPTLYTTISKNHDIFIDGITTQDSNNNLSIDTILQPTLSHLTGDEKDSIKNNLLGQIFPRILRNYDKEESEIEWGSQQRVCSHRYFKRYFTYSIPVDDISDTDINLFLEEIPTKNMPDIRKDILTVSKNDLSTLITLLKFKFGNITPNQAIVLAQAISSNADLIPIGKARMFVSYHEEAGIFISRLLKVIPDIEERQRCAEEILHNANPLSFCSECYRWIEAAAKNSNSPFFQENGKNKLLNIVVNRIKSAEVLKPAHLEFGKNASSLYYLWSKQDGRDGIEPILKARFEQHPEEMDSFIACYLGDAWTANGPVRADLLTGQYNFINEAILSAVYIMDNLTKRYGAALADPQYYDLPDDMPAGLRLAHQFAFLHNQKNQLQSQPGKMQTAAGE